MIDCLSNKHVDKLYNIMMTKHAFEKFFYKYIKRNEYLKPVGLVISDWDNMSQEELEEIHEACGAEWEQTALAITMADFMVEHSDDEIVANIRPVKKVECVIHVSMATIIKIVNMCKFPWQRKFCVKYIMRHELGHVKHFNTFVGVPLSRVKKQLNRFNIERTKWFDENSPDGYITNMTQWVSLNSLSQENEANKFGHIKNSEMIKFFKIMKCI